MQKFDEVFIANKLVKGERSVADTPDHGVQLSVFVGGLGHDAFLHVVAELLALELPLFEGTDVAVDVLLADH